MRRGGVGEADGGSSGVKLSSWLIACGDEGLLSSQSHTKLHILEIWCRHLVDPRHLKDIWCVQG